eukprot:1662982-Amphidinium_carterae.1
MEIDELNHLTVEVPGKFEVSVPASIFNSIERLGISAEVLALVAMDVSTELERMIGDNRTFLGIEATVLGALNMNLFGGGESLLSVPELVDPLFFSLHLDDPLASHGECGAWNDTASTWTNDGLTTVNDGNLLNCTTTHLTLFGGIAEGFINSLQCSQATLLTPDGFDALGGDDWYRQVSVVAFLLLVAGLLIFLVAATVFGRRVWSKSGWNDSHFLVVEKLDELAEDHEEEIAAAMCFSVFLAILWKAGTEVTRAAYDKDDRAMMNLSLEVLASFFRDIFDALLGAYCQYIHIVRETCEHIRSVLLGEAFEGGVGPWMISLSMHAAKMSFLKEAHLNASAKAGIHADVHMGNIAKELEIDDESDKASQQQKQETLRAATEEQS